MDPEDINIKFTKNFKTQDSDDEQNEEQRVLLEIHWTLTMIWIDFIDGLIKVSFFLSSSISIVGKD